MSYPRKSWQYLRRQKVGRLRDARTTVYISNTHAPRGVHQNGNDNVPCVGGREQDDRSAEQQEDGDQREGTKSDEHTPLRARERDQRAAVRREPEPGEPDRDKCDEPAGNRRREMNQGRFLAASALK